jgi:hypothetical protein
MVSLVAPTLSWSTCPVGWALRILFLLTVGVISLRSINSPSNIVYGVLLLFDLFCQHFNSELPWPPLLCEVFLSCQACNLVFRCQTCGSVPRYQAFSHNGLVLASELVASFILEVAQVQPFLSSCLLASIQLYHNMSANLMGCRSAFPRVFLWVLA